MAVGFRTVSCRMMAWGLGSMVVGFRTVSCRMMAWGLGSMAVGFRTVSCRMGRAADVLPLLKHSHLAQSTRVERPEIGDPVRLLSVFQAPDTSAREICSSDTTQTQPKRKETRRNQSNPIESNPIESNRIESNPIQSNPIESNRIQSQTPSVSPWILECAFRTPQKT
jgi:hypothetical protein